MTAPHTGGALTFLRIAGTCFIRKERVKKIALSIGSGSTACSKNYRLQPCRNDHAYPKINSGALTHRDSRRHFRNKPCFRKPKGKKRWVPGGKIHSLHQHWIHK